VITIKRLEASEETLPARYDTVVRLMDALVAAGIDFLPQAGGYSHGVQLRSR